MGKPSVSLVLDVEKSVSNRAKTNRHIVYMLPHDPRGNKVHIPMEWFDGFGPGIGPVRLPEPRCVPRVTITFDVED